MCIKTLSMSFRWVGWVFVLLTECLVRVVTTSLGYTGNPLYKRSIYHAEYHLPPQGYLGISTSTLVNHFSSKKKKRCLDIVTRLAPLLHPRYLLISYHTFLHVFLFVSAFQLRSALFHNSSDAVLRWFQFQFSFVSTKSFYRVL